MQQNSYPPASNKPGKVQAIAIMTLINGILNIFYALGVTATIVFGTLGIGLLCAPITILPAILGVFEIICGSNLLSNSPQGIKSIQTIAILEIICIISGNVLSAVIGILNLVFASDSEVKNYYLHTFGIS